MIKTVMNLKTGKAEEVPMTADEIADIEARRAEQAALAPLHNIKRLETENPITHRALRELILTIGEAFPAGKETVFYQRVLATELAIRAERAKL